ncbi:hypothetical protein GCM10010094_75790 [Streptomyces flaveus]|uniref:Uncharacterized protein n=1 Tax=Streptomyces flaveus TaxID=66370 RepID=A0A917REZ7_9ACTN|nr:hypothetical protein GCM10010094_75790 [Streptomyces flaveus]
MFTRPPPLPVRRFRPSQARTRCGRVRPTVPVYEYGYEVTLGSSGLSNASLSGPMNDMRLKVALPDGKGAIGSASTRVDPCAGIHPILVVGKRTATRFPSQPHGGALRRQPCWRYVSPHRAPAPLSTRDMSHRDHLLSFTRTS